MARVKLGKDQTILVDGAALEGTREIDIDFDLRTTDITAWDSQWASTLGTTFDATIKLTIYFADDYAVLEPKLLEHPPAPLALTISNVGVLYCLPVAVKITQPINGVLAWEVTLRLHSYNTGS